MGSGLASFLSFLNSELGVFITALLIVPSIFLLADILLYGFLLKPLFIRCGEKPGNAFIPLYNMHCLARIAGLPEWAFTLCAIFFWPGIIIWRVLISLCLVQAFDTRQQSGIYLITLIFILPVGCYVLGTSNCTYLLSEEEVVNKHIKGFSASEKKKKASKK